MQALNSRGQLVRAGATAAGLGLLVLVVLRALSFGCDNTFCHPGGYRFGAALTWGVLALAIPGGVVLRRLAGPGEREDFQLFTAAATGLLMLSFYVYLRSLFNQVAWNFPVSRWELMGWLAVAAVITWNDLRAGSGSMAWPKVWRWPLPELALLLAVGVAIADRELPRSVLLSSDPDFHVYFGLQVERFGGVPYHQHGWGDQAFNYPAGSGVLLFVWRAVTGLDLRNLLTALPLLFAVLAGFMLVEQFLGGVQKLGQRSLLMSLALAMVVGGFLFPLYPQNAHMEGGARQMAVLFVALFMVWLVRCVQRTDKVGWGWLVLGGVTYFQLMVLNPAQVAVPSCLVVALAVHGWSTGRRSWSLLLVMFGGLALGVLDPFYQKMVGYTQGARTDTVIYGPSLSIRSPRDIVNDMVALFQHGLLAFFHEFSVLLSEKQGKVFLSLLVFYAAVLGATARNLRFSRASVLATLALMGCLYGVFVVTHALGTDIRTFLLAPYVQFNLAQYKALLLVLMAISVLVTMVRAGHRMVWLVPVAVFLLVPMVWLVRDVQPMVLEPRKEDCGALGCIEEEDLALLRKFEAAFQSGSLTPPDGRLPKVLVPNAVAKMELETWIFPVSSARVLPYFRVLPAAFYYFQGDAEYGTASYLAHVCERLDRDWLLSKGIDYLYLPSERDNACLAGMESLIGTEEVVLNEGGAYLLRLRGVPAAQVGPGVH